MTRTTLHTHRSALLRRGVVTAVAVLALAGCSSATERAAPAAPAATAATGGAASPSTSLSTTEGPQVPSTAPTTAAADGLPAGAKQLSVTVTGKKIDPAPSVVELGVGQTLRLTVTSDHDDELHAHGFEKEAELVAGEPATLDLVTDQPGTYEVETHHPALRLLKVQVR